MKIKPFSFLALVALVLMGNSGAAIIAGGNGSFETNTFTNPGYVGSTGLWETTAGSVSGWTFTGTGRWFMQTNNGGSNFGEPQHGDYYVNVSLGEHSSYGFSMSTTVAGLSVGNSYAVEFYASVRNGITAGTSFLTSIDTTVVTTLTVTQASLPAIITGYANYTKQTLNFTATSENHIFTLSNTGSGNNGNGFIVDNFSVIPEPSAIFLGGLGMLALLLRRRR